MTCMEPLLPLLYTCMYGSRLDTTKSGLFCSLLLRLTRRRSAVQTETLESRRRASSWAVARAAVRSRARWVTSRWICSKTSPCGSDGGGGLEDLAVRKKKDTHF